MFNKQFAKTLLKENGITKEEKDRWIGAIIGEELTKYIEKVFNTYEGIQMVANNTAPFLDWVKDKFKEIAKRDPEDYNFEIISRPAFERYAHVDFTVRFTIKPMHERLYNSYRTITTSAIDSGYVYADTISANTINATNITAEPIRYDWAGNATIRNLDANVITARHMHNGWGNAGEHINYAEQLPPTNLLYNGTTYVGATVESMDTQFNAVSIENPWYNHNVNVRFTDAGRVGISPDTPLQPLDIGGTNNE